MKRYSVQGLSASGNLTGLDPNTLPGTESILEEFPGRGDVTPRTIARNLIGKDIPGGASWNLLEMAGVSTLQGHVRPSSRFPPAVASGNLQLLTENYHRITTFLHNLKKGVAPKQAKAISDALYVNYDPRNFSRFENEVMLRLIPFYKFSRRIIPTVLKELAQHPGGPSAALIRAINQPESEGFLPEYLQGGLAIPVGGQDEEGMQTFLTQFGLPIEQLNYFHAGPRGLTKTGLDLAGMLNPYLKAPAELLTGRQFYSDRDLRDLEGRLGRIGESVGLLDDPKSVPLLLEQAVSNSPLARVVSSAGTLVDPRKSIPAKALNLLSGLRLSDVDLPQQEAIQTRNMIEEMLRGEPGVGLFQNIYVSPEDWEKLEPEQQELYLLSKLMSQRARKARQAQAVLSP